MPARAPFDLWDRDHRHGIKLYVRRVFIMDDAEQLMPPYLRFVRGVIDSQRPAAQRVARDPAGKPRRRRRSATARTKRVLSLLEDLAREPEGRSTPSFWKEFGQVLKEGVGEDSANRERIAKLLRFALDRATSERADRVARRLRRRA